MDIDKLIYMELRKTQNNRDNVEEGDQSWRLTLDIKAYYKVTKIKW